MAPIRKILLHYIADKTARPDHPALREVWLGLLCFDEIGWDLIYLDSI